MSRLNNKKTIYFPFFRWYDIGFPAIFALWAESEFYWKLYGLLYLPSYKTAGSLNLH